MSASAKLSLFGMVCNLCRTTGYPLNTRQINILRTWIATGDYQLTRSDVELLADAIVCC